jgi:(p)ppGpp synthase/HD superfamily hydrolase
MSEYEKALEFIKDAHVGQVDKIGVDYWKHPYEVSQLLPAGAPEYARVAALLHDVVEDTGYSLDDLRERFDNQAVEIVGLLTRGDETYKQMIERIAQSGNYWAIQVKLADNAHNRQGNRAYLPQGMVKRYALARARLLQALEEF